MFTTVPFNILWAIGQLGKNKPTDVAAAQVLLNLANKPGIPPLPVDGKWSPQMVEAIRTFETKYIRRSTVSLSLEPGSTTVRALITAAIPKARLATHLAAGKETAISEGDYQDAAQSLGCEVAPLRRLPPSSRPGVAFCPQAV